MKRNAHPLEKLACLLAAALWLAASAAAQSQHPSAAPGNEWEWRFSLKPNQIVRSNIAARNACRKRRLFQIASDPLPAFMRLSGEASSNVDSHSEHLFPVEFNSTGLAPGQYEGVVVVQCVNCKQGEGCALDRQRLHIYMTVEADFFPGRVLALTSPDSPEAIAATARKLAADYGLEVAEIDPLKSLNAVLIVYALPEGADLQAKVAALAPHVLLAQPDFLYQTSGAARAQEANAYAQLQYGPKLIRADRLRGSLTGKGVKIALIDTGLDAGHPALRGKVREQADMTGLGFTPDIHATLLAGIIAGDPAEGAGISGVAPGSEILAIKACQPQSSQAIEAQCRSLALAKGLDFAIQKSARVVNLSLGGPRDALVTRLIDEAVRRQILVVAAAGNGGPRAPPPFPAALPNVVAVTAVDAAEQLYPLATEGDFIDMAAPGVEILSTSPGGKLLVSSGTSLAAAFVTGAASLALEQHPQLSPQALRDLLERTAKDLGPPGKDPQFGYGLVDACQAIGQLRGDPQLCR